MMDQNQALRAFLIEQRRHYLALAKSCEVYLTLISNDSGVEYNSNGNGDLKVFNFAGPRTLTEEQVDDIIVAE